MNISIKAALASTRFLKVTALIMGYSFWSLIGEAFPATLWLSTPLCFYNTKATTKIDAPETVWIQLRGKRSHIYKLDTKALAVHINAQELQPGPQSYSITAKSLLLPPTITVNQSLPHAVLFNVSERAEV